MIAVTYGHGVNVRELLSAHKPFRTGGAMRASDGPALECGRLPDQYRDAVRSAAYVVYSYATPVAWIGSDGTVVIPDERYSVTTSRHQGLCRAWLR